MKLIDAVKESLDANGIKYDQQMVVMPADVLIAHTVIRNQQWHCMVRAIDDAGVINVEYFLEYKIKDENTLDELVDFILLANNRSSLGTLNLDADNRVVSFKNGIHIDYIIYSQLSIAKFILRTGEEAAGLQAYVHSVAIGESTGEAEFNLLMKKSNDPLLSLKLAK